jgi:uncharacterized membrane protein YbaN (DUF454 family)
LGAVAVGLGTAGIFVPLLPTTPFLLLAAFLFARSSDRLHHWLMSHKRLGPYIHAFRGKAGLTRGQKLRICTSFTILFWITIVLVPQVVVKIILGLWWLFWMIYFYRMRTAIESLAAERKESTRQRSSRGSLDERQRDESRASSSVPAGGRSE